MIGRAATHCEFVFLIVLRAISIVTRDQDKTREFCVFELPVASFAAVNANKSSGFQIENQLTKFARHTRQRA